MKLPTMNVMMLYTKVTRQLSLSGFRSVFGTSLSSTYSAHGNYKLYISFPIVFQNVFSTEHA
uniref:Alternative protein RUFY2 n=1 Tax=Homo sapiens TaxID=9606 RepID=L8EAY6_HUMAN|nr:alternative protein RUFY2 [Homo sapiens]